MSLCLLNQPARAQYGGPQPQWVITYDAAGNVAQTAIDANGNSVPISTRSISFTGSSSDADPNSYSNNYSLSGSYQRVVLVYSNTITIHARYQNYSGQLATPPQGAKLCLRVNADVHGYGSARHGNGYSVAGDAKDGFDDEYASFTNPLANYVSGGAHGGHLIQRDGSSNDITITYTQSGSFVAIDGSRANMSDQPGCGVSLNWALTAGTDTRSVNIKSSLDTTYQKGPNNTRIPSTVEPDGTIHANSVKPKYFTPTNVTFDATYSGNWSFNFQTNQFQPTDYKWFSRLLQAGLSGTFTVPNSIPSFQNTYTSNAIDASVNTPTPNEEHIFIRLTDTVDPVSATGNYYILFHDMFEDWAKLPDYPITHPLPTNPTYNAHGEWNILGPFPQGGGTGTWSYTRTGTLTMKVGGEIGTETGLEFGDELIKATFKQHENITLGQEYASTSTTTWQTTLPPNRISYIFWGIAWEGRKGTASLYDAHGYNSTVNWTASVPQAGPNGELVLVWCQWDTNP